MHTKQILLNQILLCTGFMHAVTSECIRVVCSYWVNMQANSIMLRYDTSAGWAYILVTKQSVGHQPLVNYQKYATIK